MSLCSAPHELSSGVCNCNTMMVMRMAITASLIVSSRAFDIPRGYVTGT